MLTLLAAITTPNLPNIVWIMAEDIGPDLACYGTTPIQTPNIDQLARQGILYTNAYTVSPVCSPSRSSLMLGTYPQRANAHNHRLRDEHGTKTNLLTSPFSPLTTRLKKQGYYTANGCGFSAKTDLNFDSKNLFDSNDWKNRKPNQPFFAQITLNITHRYTNWEKSLKDQPRINPKTVTLPPYYPQNPKLQQDWANYLDVIELADAQVGKIITRLKTENLLKNTIVIFCGDNGRSTLRGKGWLYDAGLQVPLIIRYPNQKQANTKSNDLISMIDITATILHQAKAPLDQGIDGLPLTSPTYTPRQAIFAARDRIDETEDTVRSIRTQDYKYIRYYLPQNPHPISTYMKKTQPDVPVLQAWSKQADAPQAVKSLFAPTRPSEELYNITQDPWEMINLAKSPNHQSKLAELRNQLTTWQNKIKDPALTKFPNWKP